MANQEAVVLFITKNTGNKIINVPLPFNHLWVKDDHYLQSSLEHYWVCTKCNTFIVWNRYKNKWTLNKFGRAPLSRTIPNCDAVIMDTALE